MLHQHPAKFYRILGWADVEAEAEPLILEEADKKRKPQQQHSDLANRSLRGR